MFIRATLPCMFCKMFLEDEKNCQAAPVSNLAMEPTVEMVIKHNPY